MKHIPNRIIYDTNNKQIKLVNNGKELGDELINLCIGIGHKHQIEGKSLSEIEDEWNSNYIIKTYQHPKYLIYKLNVKGRENKWHKYFTNFYVELFAINKNTPIPQDYFEQEDHISDRYHMEFSYYSVLSEMIEFQSGLFQQRSFDVKFNNGIITKNERMLFCHNCPLKFE